MAKETKPFVPFVAKSEQGKPAQGSKLEEVKLEDVRLVTTGAKVEAKPVAPVAPKPVVPSVSLHDDTADRVMSAIPVKEPKAAKIEKAGKKAVKAEAKVEMAEVKAEAKAEIAEAKAAKAGAREVHLPKDADLVGPMLMGDLLAALSDRYPQYDIVPLRWMRVKVPGGEIIIDFADVNDYKNTAELRAYINALPVMEGNKPNG